MVQEAEYEDYEEVGVGWVGVRVRCVGWMGVGWVGVRVRVCLCVHVLYRVCKMVVANGIRLVTQL